MLQLKNIRKAYTTDSFTQVALDDVSVTFRDNEFVAILGPSGSGKTTMLNILGGLDHADSGEIVINGVSTRDYTDKDWDTYRNHSVGFVFQSYNLIPHQTILSNVELALTLAGIGYAERRERARKALERVGLGDHVNKRPNQLSGGQMQRVAIARALVNNPDIVLADEPTGALDTETGIQIMDLLSEVARDRLVVMVTHNPELAEQYATRIVRVRDGHVDGDTNPLTPEELAHKDDVVEKNVESKGKAHASMSFLTALALSFNNLMTKKGRTFMTAFAGSIGIIGIAAILALSNGVNHYIAKTEEDALSSYPLTITKSSFDLSSMFGYGYGDDDGDQQEGEDTIHQTSIMTDMFAQVKNNDLRAFRSFLQSGESGIDPYVNTIQYTYALTPQIYKSDTSEGISRLNPSNMSNTLSSGFMGSALSGGSSMGSFSQLIDNREMLDAQVEVVRGRWPERYDEAVLILNRNGGVSDYTLYSLGFYDTSVMDKMTQQALAGEDVTVPEDQEREFTYDDALSMSFSVVPASSLYQKNNETGTWANMTSDSSFMRDAIANGIQLKVVGVVKPTGDNAAGLAREGIGYTSALVDHLMADADASDVVREQKADPKVDVFTGKTFEELQSDQDNSFDMGSLFTVDEQALSRAFSMDTSALSSLGSGMGSLDLSGLDMGSMDMGAIDLSKMDFDASGLGSILTPEAIAGALEDVPPFDVTSIKVDLTDEQQLQVLQTATALQQDFARWLLVEKHLSMGDLRDMETLRANWQEYSATPEAQQIMAPLDGVGDSVQEAVNNAMNEYMTEKVVPAVSGKISGLLAQAAQLMTTQIAQQLQSQMSAMTGNIGSALSSAISGQLMEQMNALSSALSSGFSFDANAFANAIHVNMTQEDLASLLTNYMNAEELSYDANLAKLGFADVESPDSISIYPKDFQAKESVLGIIDDYNQARTDEGNEDATIQYSDIAGTLMSSVTDIVDMISLVLIAFVSISLVVSSIMIGIITYISVLERKKEIGILRAMGASKLNVANVFNAETIIEGLIAGVFAILVVVLVSVPVNAIVLETQGVADIMILPVQNAITLIAISVALTFVAGLMPSSAASRRDPVEALRSE